MEWVIKNEPEREKSWSVDKDENRETAREWHTERGRERKQQSYMRLDSLTVPQIRFI